MPLTDAREKFIQELRMGYDEEHRYLQAQGQLAALVSDEEFRGLLERHTEETRQHIQNLESIFSRLGQEPERGHNKSAQGQIEDAQQGAHSAAEGPIRDCLLLGAQGRVEALEIAGYRELIGGAEGVLERDAIALLEQNLQQEERTAREIEALRPRLERRATRTALGTAR